MGDTTRSFPPGHFLLELGGVSAGSVKNIQGGGAVAEVVKETPGADHIVRKHIGTVRYDDIVLTCGAGLSKAFYDWVGHSSTMQGERKDGAVIVFDNGKEISRLNWHGGLITEIDFPALDAGSKDPFSMTIKISPEFTRHVKGGGGQAPGAKAQKNWLASTFRLTIDGLEAACSHVSRIEPISLALKTQRNEIGEMRGYSEMYLVAAEPGNLFITLPEAKAEGFYDWFEDFVIKGNSGQEKEKNGTLESGPLSLKFGNLGPMRMTAPSDLPGGMIRKTSIEMFCESIRFSASAAATGH